MSEMEKLADAIARAQEERSARPRPDLHASHTERITRIEGILERIASNQERHEQRHDRHEQRIDNLEHDRIANAAAREANSHRNETLKWLVASGVPTIIAAVAFWLSLAH